MQVPLLSLHDQVPTTATLSEYFLFLLTDRSAGWSNISFRLKPHNNNNYIERVENFNPASKPKRTVSAAAGRIVFSFYIKVILTFLACIVFPKTILLNNLPGLPGTIDQQSNFDYRPCQETSSHGERHRYRHTRIRTP